MKYQKDGKIHTIAQIKKEHRHVGFCEDFDFTQLGYIVYAEPEFQPSGGEILRRLGSAVQRKLDDTAQDYRYDNILSARTAGLGSTNPKFQAEGAAFSKWWNDVWTYVDKVEDDVRAGVRDLPTPKKLVAELPKFTVVY